jgi:hypothetical protein
MATAPPVTLATPSTSAANPPDGDQTAFYLVLTFFRQTNAEGLRIRQRVADAMKLAAAANAAAIASAFREAREVIVDELGQATARADSIDQLQNVDPGTEAWYAREIIQVNNAWDDMSRLWEAPLTGQETPAALLAKGRRSLAVLDDMIILCARQTIPDELSNYLGNYRIGTCLDFLSTFKDQLPDEASTRLVLESLAPQSVLVPGLIDVRNAMVIKADRRPSRQMLSVAIVLLTVAIGFALAGVAANLGHWTALNLTGWALKPSEWATLNGAYLMVLLGVLAHWVLDRVKQNRAGSDITPFSEWLMWIHVNEVPITVRIMSVWLMIALGIAFKMFDISTAAQPVTFFTAGYFMDSTFDALIGRFNTFIAAQDPAKAAKAGDKQPSSGGHS